MRRRLPSLIFGSDEETPEGIVGRLLRKRKKTLAVAESCTGGLLQHRLTEVAGSSDYFRGGIVAYSNGLKRSLLGVSEKLLRNHGAVSAPVAREMARNVRRQAGSDIGLAITGIAGPTGGTRQKPVGLVYIALSTRKQAFARRYLFTGGRSTVKLKATQAALGLLKRGI